MYEMPSGFIWYRKWGKSIIAAARYKTIPVKREISILLRYKYCFIKVLAQLTVYCSGYPCL
ncbi:MAG: hypothetical protein A2V64_03655 [Bacteroidetes bacterium RBG_13_43_22]|nr:MAG: hypothetical protein A2V64_03655 [Bacteroidetes bacterium RBG_13_43_22]